MRLAFEAEKAVAQSCPFSSWTNSFVRFCSLEWADCRPVSGIWKSFSVKTPGISAATGKCHLD